LVVLPGGGLLIDTPGMRALSVVDAGEGVERAFQDVEELARACEHTNCGHAGERGCALAAALSDGRLERGRLEAWLRLRAEPRSSDYEAARRGVEDRKRRKAVRRAGRRLNPDREERGVSTGAMTPVDPVSATVETAPEPEQ